MEKTSERFPSEKSLVFGLIGNIPGQYHSSDLRNYFSQVIETGCVDCFHFRHRPEGKFDVINSDSVPSKSYSNETSNQRLYEKQSAIKDVEKNKNSNTCCIIRCKAKTLKDLIKVYHRKHWLDREGESLPSLCFISKIKLQNSQEADSSEISSGKVPLTEDDVLKLPELNPPDIMPNGNVGTPTKTFLQFIKECRLPPVVIKKLGLSFPKTRTNKKYGMVPYEYEGTVESGDSEDEPVKSSKGHDILKEGEADLLRQYSSAGTNPGVNHAPDKKDTTAEYAPDGSEHDDDSCEEWERHEANYDDPGNYERNKEKVFEEELEIVWEKGGSGLVFYTDAQHWKQQEGDFDEQTADDWDVDFSAYYEPGAGDKDIRDFITMRQEDRRRAGVEDTDIDTAVIGKFEKHTKGIGSRVMRKHGWTEGKGLGTWKEGIKDALDNEGQNPRDKKGLGYYGEKLPVYIAPKRPRRKEEGDPIITTIYDTPEETDPTEPLLRRKHPHNITYRSSHANVNFCRATKSSTDSQNTV